MSKILIGCEFSGVVRDAFRARGYDAWSCDLLPSESPGPHLQCDIFSVLNRGWDLLVFHWPCTRLANSGVRWLYGGKGTVRDEARWVAMEDDAAKFRALLDCEIPRICGENPIPHGYAKVIMRDYSQVISTLDVRAWRDEGDLSVAAESATITADKHRRGTPATRTPRVTGTGQVEEQIAYAERGGERNGGAVG